jgi:subtilisin family serine protease
VGQQWALYNDGSFQMEEEENQYPVYDDPFGTPSLPGRWTAPWNFGRPGGWNGFGKSASASTAQQTQAVAGIDINAEDAWAVYDGGKRDVVIALIDTGVDTTHEELKDAIWVNGDEIPGNGVDDDGNGYVDDVNGWNFYNNSNKLYVSSTEDSHGTHGAGTIAAKANDGTGTAGIVQSDHVKIMVLKALGGSDGSGTTASVIQAIQYAQANGASICNLSLGNSTDDRALYRVMANSSMLFVVAAGNDGANTDSQPSYPASYDLDNIISVANLNYDGTLHYSSNYGAVSVDLAAPGSYILSTTPNNDYSFMTGTSMAAPMVTAAAAMVYSYYENITLADVKEILLSSVHTLDSLSGNTATGGMLDLGAAMTYDLTKLSGAVWDTGAVEDAGTAPEITVTTQTRQNASYLIVQVTDAEGDLDVTAYAPGIHSAEQFRSGGVGQTFSLGSDGTKVFSVTSSGIYTFYAADKAGNESVQAVFVLCRTRSPGLYWGWGS